MVVTRESAGSAPASATTDVDDDDENDCSNNTLARKCAEAHPRSEGMGDLRLRKSAGSREATNTGAGAGTVVGTTVARVWVEREDAGVAEEEEAWVLWRLRGRGDGVAALLLLLLLLPPLRALWRRIRWPRNCSTVRRLFHWTSALRAASMAVAVAELPTAALSAGRRREATMARKSAKRSDPGG